MPAPARPDRKAFLAGLGVLLGVPLLLVGGALRPGRVLSSADMLLGNYMLIEAMQPGFATGNTQLADPAFQFLPWRRLVAQEAREGRVAFWNPHAFAGAQLLGNSQSGVFDVLSFPYRLVEQPARATVWVALLRIWVAALGAALLARRLGCGAAASILAGLIYGLGGFTTVFLLYPNASSSAWAPWAMLAAERLATRRDAVATVGLAATLTLSVFGGHAEVAFFAAAAASAYVLLRRRSAPNPRHGSVVSGAGALAAVGALTVALSAVQVLPFLETASQGTLAGARRAQLRSSPLWRSPRLDRAVLLVFPYLYGRPVRGEVNVAGAGTNFVEQSGAYASLLGLALALVGVGVAARGPGVRAFATIGAGAWLYAISFPPFPQLSRYIPGLDILPPQRAMFITLLALAVTAAAGADTLARPEGERARKIARRLGVVIGAILLIGAQLLVVWNGLAPAERAGLVKAALQHEPLARWYAGQHQRLVAEVASLSPAFARQFLLPWAVIAAATAGMLLAARRLGRWLPLAACAVVGADLLLFGHRFNPVVDEAAVYPVTRRLEQLREAAGDGRVAVLDWGLPACVATYYGLDDINGYDAIGRSRLEKLLRLAGTFPVGPPHWPIVGFNRYDSPVLDVLSVRAVAMSGKRAASRLRLLHDEHGFALYENPHALPRAFVPREIITVASLAEAETAARERAVDPAATAIVEAAAPVAAGEGLVVLRRVEPSRLVLEATMERGGAVLVSEGFDTGWRASTGGRTLPVHPADIALLAVEVPAGRHIVDLVYRPRTWPAAVALFCGGVGAVVLLLAVAARRAA
jgi:hypothetical protein